VAARQRHHMDQSRRRAGAALSTPAAASSRLLPPDVAPVLAPRSLLPRLPLRVWCAPPPLPSLTPRSLRPRVSRCRVPGFRDAATQAGRIGEGEVSVGGDGFVLDCAMREALGLWRGGSTKRRRRTTAFGPSLVACRKRRLTVCTEKSINTGKKNSRRDKKKHFVVIELLLFTCHKARCNTQSLRYSVSVVVVVVVPDSLL